MAILSDKSNIANAPRTPSKRSREETQLLTPKTTPKKAKLDLTGLYTSSVYTRAKSLFQRGGKQNHDGPHLLGRENEGTTLNTFLQEKISENISSSMYIAGPPGTGKSESINSCFKHLQENYGMRSTFISRLKAISDGQAETNQDNVSNVVTIQKKHCKLVKINCMVVANPHHIFHEIYCTIMGQLSISFFKKKTSTDLKEMLSLGDEKINSVVVVLDEMDCLITKNQEILFELFSLSSADTKLKLILVGISNSLDFTNKFMPRLKVNGLHPQLLQFLPYTFEQTKYIVSTKLQSLQEEANKENELNEVAQIPLFHPAALQLCCKKAASITGDLRTAFDLVYKSIELVENSVKQSGKDIETLTIQTCPKVLLPHVARVCSQSFNNTNTSSNTGKTIGNLNLLQKTTLCYLFKYQVAPPTSNNKPRVGGATINAFYDYYLSHNNIDKLVGTVKKGEFFEILSALESSALILLTTNSKLKVNDSGSKLIKLNIRHDDLIKSIGDIGVLKKIISSQ